MDDNNNHENEHVHDSFTGKVLKQILIANKGYDKDEINIEIGCSNIEDKYNRYTLKKIDSINDINVFLLECDIPLNNNTIRFTCPDIELVKIDNFKLMHSIFYSDDRNYNHVNDILKYSFYEHSLKINDANNNNKILELYHNASFLVPPHGQTSYGVYINTLHEEKSAISLFITD